MRQRISYPPYIFHLWETIEFVFIVDTVICDAHFNFFIGCKRVQSFALVIDQLFLGFLAILGHEATIFKLFN